MVSGWEKIIIGNGKVLGWSHVGVVSAAAVVLRVHQVPNAKVSLSIFKIDVQVELDVIERGARRVGVPLDTMN